MMEGWMMEGWMMEGWMMEDKLSLKILKQLMVKL